HFGNHSLRRVRFDVECLAHDGNRRTPTVQGVGAPRAQRSTHGGGDVNGAIKRSWIGVACAAIVACPRPSLAQASDTTSVSGPEQPTTEDVAGRLESLSEQVQTLQGDTDKLKKFKFSGYIQVRWEHAENQSDSVAVGGNPVTITPANSERFYI